MLLEVLPLEHGPRQDLAHAGDERLDHLVVGVAAQARVPPAHVQRIHEELHAVRADVQRDREREPRVDAGRGGVQRELAHGDRHAAGSLVAQAEDPLVVGDDDQPDLVERGVAQDLGHAVDVVRRDPDAARTAPQVAEVLARTADGGRVDDREQLLEVVQQHAVEEGLVAVMQGRQADVALEVVRLAPDVLELQRDLVVDVHDARREEAPQPQVVDARRR